jgi:aspartyl-tRNA(Asn)/glutamyl-tRNA(Gln) amidotransferase subunit A
VAPRRMIAAFDVDLEALAERRFGAAAAPGLAANLERLRAHLDVLADLPSAEPGPWPPPLPPAQAPAFRLQPVDDAADLAEAGVVALSSAVAAERITPVEIVAALIERATRVDPRISAWALLDADRTRAAAERRTDDARSGRLRGPLHGVPLGIKDIIDVAGLPTGANSAIRAGVAPATDDAESVARLRAAGAIILGKTHTTEFALSDPSPARNPWNTAHTPGGSSSGSAAGVAGRLIPGALGTQTAGSVLRPAAFCGIVGFKPSSGRVSRDGVIPLAWSLDHVGTLTRSVADAAALFAVLSGAAECRPSAGPPRLALAAGFLADHTDETTRQSLRSTAATLESAGARVETLDLTPLGAVAPAVQSVIMWSEVAAFHLGEHAARLHEIGPRLRATVQAGSLLPAQALLRAQGMRRLLHERWDRMLRAYDAVIVPAAAGTAPEGLDFTGDPSLNAPWTLLGVPAITIPTALAPNGLPLGMQLVAPYGEDARLLAVAHWCEQAVGFTEGPDL